MQDLYDELRRSSASEVAAERDKPAAIIGGFRDGFCSLDPDGHLVGMNPASESLLGEREALLGEPILERFRFSRREDAQAQPSAAAVLARVQARPSRRAPLPSGFVAVQRDVSREVAEERRREREVAVAKARARIHDRRFGGTGLGLAISKQLVELMGEALAALCIDDSLSKPVRQSPLHEALVRIIHCRTRHVQRPAPARDAPNATQSPESGIRLRGHVLLVEDNAINQRVALSMLTRLGLAADVADDGRKALAAAARGRYDLKEHHAAGPDELDAMHRTGRIRQTGQGSAQVADLHLHREGSETGRVETAFADPDPALLDQGQNDDGREAERAARECLDEQDGARQPVPPRRVACLFHWVVSELYKSITSRQRKPRRGP
jgi:CheY-like chemotaxis protein